MATMTFQITGPGIKFDVTVTELANGDLEFTVEWDDSSARIGDIRGIYFHINEALFGSGTLSIDGDPAIITDYDIDKNNVVDLGNGSNMEGVDEGPYDVGVEVGTPGASPDDIQSATFTLSYSDGDLTLSDVGEMDFGLRVNSVGLKNGANGRDDSLKLTGESPEPPVSPTGGQLELIVEEEQLSGGNDDTTPNPEDEDNGGLNNTTDMDDGTLEFTAGTLALESFVFGDVTGLNTDTDGNAGTDELFWYRVSDTQINGYIDGDNTTGTLAIQIDLLSIPTKINPFQTGGPTVKVTLFENLIHEDPNTNVEEVLDLGSVNVIATATDGQTTAQGTVFIKEIDDVPIADIVLDDGSVTIDETAGLQGTDPAPTTDADEDENDDDVDGDTTLFDKEGDGGAISLATLFNITNQGADGSEFPQYALSDGAVVDVTGSSVGADSEGATTVVSLGINGGDNTDSGLTTTGSALPVRLVMEGDLIVGRVDSNSDGDVTDGDAGDVAVFAIAIDQDGNLAVVQYMSLDNPSAASDDDPVDLVDGTTNLIFAEVTVTDSDGDEHSAQVDIGQKVIFEDDGPVADIQAGSGSVTIDETAGLQDGVVPTDPDRGTGADPDNDDVTSAATLNGVALSVVFGGVSNPGSDGSDFEQYALSAAPLVDFSLSDFGQDDEGATSTVLSLEIADADSDLTTTDGAEIKLFEENGLIVGRYDATTGLLADVDSSDPAAFAIAIGDDGNVATVQYVSLNNPTSPDNFDEPVDLTGKVNAVVTVTDGDGDVDRASTDIGDQIFFEDDGPTLADPNNTVVAFVDSTAIDPADNDVAEPTSETDGDDVVTIDFDPGADDEGASLKITDYIGKDGPGEFSGTGLDDLEALLGPITVTSTDTSVTYWTDGGTEKLFELTVNVDDPDNYTFQVLQNAPLVFDVLDFSELKSGGPQEVLVLTTESGTKATFDGYLFSGNDGTLLGTPMNFPADTKDDLNPDNLGFGVKNGQASNINNNEGWEITFNETSGGMAPKTVAGFQFDIDQQGNTDDFVIAFEVTNGGTDVGLVDVIYGSGFDPSMFNTLGDPFGQDGSTGDMFVYSTTPDSQNQDIEFVIIKEGFEGEITADPFQIIVIVDDDFDRALFKVTYPQDEDPLDFTNTPFENDSIRVKDITVIEQDAAPDVELAFSVQGTDGDGDMTQIEQFTVGIDGDDDGLITIA